MRQWVLNRLIVLFAVALATTSTTSGQDTSFKRRDNSTDEDLRKELLRVPEAGFDIGGAAAIHTLVGKVGTGKPGFVTPPPDIGIKLYTQFNQSVRPDLLALPWKTGDDCNLGREAAEELHVLSTHLRSSMRRSVPANDVRPEPGELKRILGSNPKGKDQLTKPEAIPTLTQMLQAENTNIRLLLVEYLAGIEGKKASLALAQRAVFDLAPSVRAKAAEALKQRPIEHHQQFLIESLRWPWTPAADHAAETLAHLQAKDAVQDLIGHLKEPDPKLAFKDKNGTMIREVVRVNHMCSCFLCHAPSFAKDDLVRGRVPEPNKDPPPLYYADTTGLFVRADITYLRQDFSVVQPVANSGKWPGYQRFDYLLRTRTATAQETSVMRNALSKPLANYPQRDAVLFALREITKEDKGSKYEDWMTLLNPLQEPKT